MGELRGRPDLPPEQPDRSEPARDRTRSPEPASDSNNDPRAIRDAFRRAEDPAFAPPGEPSRVKVRHETSHDPGPVGPRPYLTAKDTPAPRTKPDAPDGPTRRAMDAKGPSGEELLEKDAPEKPRRDKLREALFEEVDDISDAMKDAVNTIDEALDRPNPTGHYVQCRPVETEAHSTQPYGVDAGTGAAAMLATGLFIGEMTRRAYHKAAELKERSHARNG